MQPSVIQALRTAEADLLYLRVTIAAGDDETTMTLYEVDTEGWVYRQFQLREDKVRFAPEDILMCRPVNLRAMTAHPCTDVVEPEEFELLWSEVARERPFVSRLPDARKGWEGVTDAGVRLRWQPTGAMGPEWSEVPGFLHLYVLGDEHLARRGCSEVFLERPIQWRAVIGDVVADTTLAAAA